MAHIGIEKHDIGRGMAFVQLRPGNRHPDMQEFELALQRIDGRMRAMQDDCMPIGQQRTFGPLHLITFSDGDVWGLGAGGVSSIRFGWLRTR